MKLDRQLYRTSLPVLALLVVGLAGLSARAEVSPFAGLSPLVGQPQWRVRQAGESVYAIARRSGVGATAVFNANASSNVGERLLIPTQRVAPLLAAEGLVLNLPERVLYLYQGGKVTHWFPVGVGRRGWETPTGSFAVVNKRKNPTWFPPEWAAEEEPVPPGPKNPLGSRWLGLSARSVGIHSTNKPSSVGGIVSHGCIRMYPEHAEALFELVPVGTPVQIIYRTSALGCDETRGRVFLVIHPDPYRRVPDRLAEVTALLQSAGLEGLMDPATLAAECRMTRGVPLSVLGSDIRIKRGLEVLPISPTPRGSELLVPARRFGEALGLAVSTSPVGATVVTGGRTVLIFTAGEREAWLDGASHPLPVAPVQAANEILIPFYWTCEALGFSVGWHEPTRTAVVWGDGRLLGAPG